MLSSRVVPPLAAVEADLSRLWLHRDGLTRSYWLQEMDRLLDRWLEVRSRYARTP